MISTTLFQAITHATKERRVDLMRISDLQSLLKVVELQSISKAAEHLYITQQGLSRIINNLEKELDVTLFLRRSNTIELTEIGKKVVEHASEINGNYSAMLRDINQYQSSDLSESDYTIYATPVICITLLPKIFLSLYQEYPWIKFNVIETLPPRIADEITFDSNSIGILSIADFLSRDSIRLTEKQVCFTPGFSDRLMLSVREDSPLAKKSSISLEELADIPVALHNTETSMMEHLLGASASKVIVHTTNHELCRGMVSRGLAAGLTSDFLEYYLPSSHTAHIPLEHSVEIDYGCVYTSEALSSPITKSILELVEQELRRCREQQNET